MSAGPEKGRMSNQPPPSADSTPTALAAAFREPTTQGQRQPRARWPAWLQQMPYLRMPAPRRDYTLINRLELRRALAGTDETVIERIEADIDALESDLMPYFNQRDAAAAAYQNRFRLFQISYIGLAMLATVLGSLMVLTLRDQPALVPIFGFLETAVALFAAFLANLSGQGEQPLPAWLDNRRRAENLRRECYRYLLHLPPYDGLSGFARRTLMARRAAQINQGRTPDPSPEETQP